MNINFGICNNLIADYIIFKKKKKDVSKVSEDHFLTSSFLVSFEFIHPQFLISFKFEAIRHHLNLEPYFKHQLKIMYDITLRLLCLFFS